MSDTSYMVYDYPEPPAEKPAPICPVCKDECEYLYRRLFTNQIIGCDVCIERIYAADEY